MEGWFPGSLRTLPQLLDSEVQMQKGGCEHRAKQSQFHVDIIRRELTFEKQI